MGADLFGSLAESTCAALVVSATTLVADGGGLPNVNDLMYPLNNAAFSMIVCIFCGVYGLYKPVTQNN